MADRRKLIVVSNRGPGLVPRETRRRLASGGAAAAGSSPRSQASLARHDVTWIASAMTEEDRAVAARPSGGAVDETARDGSPSTGSGSSRTSRDGLRPLLQRRRQPDALVRAALRSGASRPRRTSTRRSTHAWEEGYVTVNRGFADAVCGGARAGADGVRVLPRLPPLLRPRLRAGRASRGDARALRAHPVAAAGLLARAPGFDPPRGARGAAGERPRRVPHRPLARELPSLVRRPDRGVDRLHRARGALPRTAHRRALLADLRRSVRVRRARDERARARGRGRARGRAAGAPDPPRRPDRSVEERRPGLPGVRALPRRAPGAAPARPDAGAPRPVPAGHPGLRGVPRGDPARPPAR